MTPAAATSSHAPGPDARWDADLARAVQESEARRAALLLVVLVCLIALVTLRNLAGGPAMESSAYIARLVILTAATVYAVAVTLVVRRAHAGGRILPRSFWIATAVVESTFPSFTILSLIRYSATDPLNDLAAPAMLVYFLFTILSVLRLRPGLSLLSAALAAAQHAAIVVWTTSGVATIPPGERNGILVYYLTYSVLILVGGVCAAIVGREIRRHVHAGLREAQARAALADVQKSLEIARGIQQSLLPQDAARIDGFQISAWSRPADQTGGDYYDWMTLPDGRVAVIIADVTGHGIGPALLMAVCRAYARAAVPAVSPLQNALAHLNRLVSRDLTDGRFVTFAIAVLSPGTDAIEFLAAGHGPTLVFRRADGSVESLHGDGLPLGVIPDEPFMEARRIVMAPGDMLLLVTDGFMEARGPGGQYGIPRLSAAFAAQARAPIDQILPRIDADVRDFMRDTPQGDDMTAVVIRRVGAG